MVSVVDNTFVDIIEKYKVWKIEEGQREIEREVAYKKWRKEEDARLEIELDVRRKKNKEEAKKQKEFEEKMEADLKKKEEMEALAIANGEELPAIQNE